MPDDALYGTPADVFERMRAIRRTLHADPELSWSEQRTMERIGARLTELGVAHRTGVAGTGVVADLPGRADGPIVALRADTDALPVHEETGLPFASRNDGVMHACGHDGHTSMLLGATELLLAKPPPTPVRLLWQPAEERAEGAAAMIREGVLDGVQMIFGGHVDRHYPPGFLAVHTGTVNASTDSFEILIQGRGGHGARPHEALDAVVVGSLMVTAIQTIVSREIDPARPSVISVGVFDAGTAPNVIAGRARLAGTIRAQDEDVREHLQASLSRVASAIGQLHCADVRFTLQEGTPPLVNVGRAVVIAREAAVAVVGEDNVGPLKSANMGGEDFACFLDHVPGCYVRFGAQVTGRESFPAHSSQFDFDEEALAVGAAWFDAVARRAGEALRGEA